MAEDNDTTPPPTPPPTPTPTAESNPDLVRLQAQSHGTGGDLLRVLELLAHYTRLSFEPQQAWRSLALAARGLHRGDEWVEVLVNAAGSAGLRALPAHLPMAEVRARIGPEAPAVTFLGPTPHGGRWLLAKQALGPYIDGLVIEDGDERVVRLSARKLQQLLELPTSDTAATWVFFEQALPLDAMHKRQIEDHSDKARMALSRLRTLIRLERGDIWVVVIYAVAIGGLSLATPIAVQALVNTVAFGSLLQPLFVLPLLLFGSLSMAAVLKALAAQVVEVLQQRLFVRAIADIARRLPRVDLHEYDKFHGPELVNRFFDVLTLQKAVSSLLLDGVSIALQAVVGMLLLAFYHPMLLAFDIVLLVGLTVVVLVPMREAIRTSLTESDTKYASVAWLEEIARNPAVFKADAASHHAVAQAEVLARAYLVARRAHFSRLFRQIVGGLALQVIASVALLGVGGLLVLERQLTLGQLVAAELVVGAVSASFAALGKHLETFYDVLAGVQKLGKLIDLPLEASGDVAEFVEGPASVRFVKVDYTFVGGRVAAKNFSATVSPGERVLLTGGSGAGKSAMLQLCAGYRCPQRGQVEVDGIDLRVANRPLMRDQVALVTSNTIFAGSVADNLRLNAPDQPYSTLRAALRLVDLDDTIATLPDGIDTLLVPTGAPLSATQTRRLVLARGLAAKPRLLLLDGILDQLKLPDDRFHALLEHIFAEDAPWTILVVSDDPTVRAFCTRKLELQAST